MWVAKFKIDGSKGLIGSRTKKYNISLSGYPVSTYIKNNWVYVNIAGLIFGEEKNKKAFLEDFKKSKRVLKIEQKGDFLIGKIKEPGWAKQVYHSSFIHLEPILIKPDGFELFTIGSWERKELTKLVKIMKKTHNAKLLKIYEENITNISIMSIQPKLTDKQKKAIDLAIKNGYYECPRNIELEKLAKLMKISYSTYQVHLRKAEKKLLPFFSSKV